MIVLHKHTPHHTTHVQALLHTYLSLADVQIRLFRPALGQHFQLLQRLLQTNSQTKDNQSSPSPVAI